MRKKLPAWIWYKERKRKALRKRILKRDNHSCQACGHTWGIIDNKKKLHIHHLDMNRSNDHDNNLVTLCASCHATLHNKLRAAGVHA